MMDEGDSSGAGAIPESIKRAYLLLLSEPRQEQEQRSLKLYKPASRADRRIPLVA
jgi:hypothetical protein